MRLRHVILSRAVAAAAVVAVAAGALIAGVGKAAQQSEVGSCSGLLNTNEDGYAGTAPVGCFKPNGYGLYDVIGNVWEWTGDWYKAGHPREEAVNPTGPDVTAIRVSAGQSASRVIKSGSHLCGSNYCSRYRLAARQPQETNLSAAHLGFRTVLNKPRVLSPQ
jgi:formylglycine-generating enzyme required for sulfatase activity